MTLFGPLISTDLVLNDDGSVSDAGLLAVGAGGITSAGVRVTEQGSMGLTAVFRAVSLLASSVAGLPLHAYRQSGGTRTQAGAGAASSLLLRAPHPDLTLFEWLELLMTHLCLWGNAYLLIVRDGLGRPVQLLPIHPASVQPDRRKSDRAKIYTVSGTLPDGSRGRTLGDLDVLHIPGLGYDGVAGLSPIRAARQGVALAMAAEEFGAKLFGSGSLATGILRTDKTLTEKQAGTIQKRWTDKMTGLDTAHRTIVLDSGATFERLTIPPDDAQFIESRSFQISEVARMFGVPPHMLAATEKSTSWGTGIEQQTIGFVTYTLRPWLSRIEHRLTRLLQPQTVYVRFNLEGLLRGDSAQRSAFYRAMFGMGALNTNEIRAYEDLEPVDGGEARYRPLNMGQLGEFETEPVAAPQPADEPPNVQQTPAPGQEDD